MRNAIQGSDMRFGQATMWVAMTATLAFSWGCGDPATTSTDDVAVEGSDVEPADQLQDDAEVGSDVLTDVVPPDVAPDQVDLDADVTADASPDIGDDDVATDVADDTDTVVNPCPGGDGCACTSNSQCNSAFCIDTPAGQQCAALCKDDACADEAFKCATVSGADGPANICVPKYGKVCNPCNTNAECEGPGHAGDRCVSQADSGAFCGTACVVDLECPAGYECKDVTDVGGAAAKQCIVKDGGACSCSDSAKTAGLSTTCFSQSGDQKCQGKRTCGAAGLSGCVADAPFAETCDGKDNDCDGETDEATCNDDNPCTDDLCQGNGGCKHTNNASACNADDSVCTKDDVCVNGSCVPGAAIVCDDNNVCTTDSCDPKEGCKFTPADGTPCNADDSECTMSDSCLAGACEPGPKKSCDTGDQCIEGKCNVLNGKCAYVVKDTSPCNDGNPCTAGELCKGEQCLGSAVNCDDQNGCTADSCDPKTGCVHANLTSVCDDKDACTENDVCGEGACKGAAVDVAKKCDDSNPCTTDSCDTVKGCVHAPGSGAVCDDGNNCTVGDKCESGVCASGKNDCDCKADLDCAGMEDGNLCNGTLYCNKVQLPFKCETKVDTIIKCDESVNGPCQTNVCNPQSGLCGLVKKPKDLPCDADDNVCTKNDSCQDGQCVAGLVQTCNDNNPCTSDSCDAQTGCKFTNNTSPCDADQNACSVGDVCEVGSCVAGKKTVCDDGEGCTKDTCDPVSGKCAFEKLTASCSDDNACTSGDACAQNNSTNTYTCVSGKAVVCDDSNVCTTDSCDVKDGCVKVNDNTAKVACYTGDPATRTKGKCKDGTQQCKDGSLGQCLGQVLPDLGDPCDGVDNDCDGIVDKGCAPKDFSAHFSTGSVSGKGTKYAARAVTGASTVAGTASGGEGKYSASLGFYSWVKALLGI
jgi:hypothetical protein